MLRGWSTYTYTWGWPRCKLLFGWYSYGKQTEKRQPLGCKTLWVLRELRSRNVFFLSSHTVYMPCKKNCFNFTFCSFFWDTKFSNYTSEVRVLNFLAHAFLSRVLLVPLRNDQRGSKYRNIVANSLSLFFTNGGVNNIKRNGTRFWEMFFLWICRLFFILCGRIPGVFSVLWNDSRLKKRNVSFYFAKVEL